MPFNGSGQFAPLSTGFPFIPDTLIDANIMDPLISDIANGISNTIAKDGQSSPTANIPFNGFKATNMAPGSARTDSATLANIQDATGLYAAIVGGTGDAITLTLTPAIGAYVVGQTFRFIATTFNTGAVTVQISGLAVKPLTWYGNVSLIANDLHQGALVEMTYDGTEFLLGTTPASSPLTNQNLTNITLINGAVSADPVASLGVASKQYVDALWTTGDVKVTLKTVADSGWVLFDDGTIGNAASPATTRANADTAALFTLLWTNTLDAHCAVSGGRGASASADFGANKTIALPKVLGRELAVAGTGNGLTARALASAIGVQDATLVAHTHQIILGAAASGSADIGQTNFLRADSSSGLGTPFTESSGSSAAGANISPRVHLNIMVKL